MLQVSTRNAPSRCEQAAHNRRHQSRRLQQAVPCLHHSHLPCPCASCSSAPGLQASASGDAGSTTCGRPYHHGVERSAQANESESPDGGGRGGAKRTRSSPLQKMRSECKRCLLAFAAPSRTKRRSNIGGIIQGWCSGAGATVSKLCANYLQPKGRGALSRSTSLRRLLVASCAPVSSCAPPRLHQLRLLLTRR